MGVRKHKVAEARKEANKTISFAKLNNCPTSPRKMRLVADMVRGLSIDKALYLLKYNPKEASGRLEKLLLSAQYSLRFCGGCQAQCGAACSSWAS
jgi:large subunit ribosomal protein L22